MTDAEFSKEGDPRYFWTERVVALDEEIALTWYSIGEPLLIHTQPNAEPGRPYGVCTVLIPALGARLTRNGVQAIGQAVAARARRSAVQHLRAGVLRKLDRGALNHHRGGRRKTNPWTTLRTPRPDAGFHPKPSCPA